jgi:transposase
VNRNAAGIDLAATVHYVAVPPGRDPEGDVRCFETFTADLAAIADWLTRCGVDTVAMESTGVYWIPLYELLEQRGFEVLLINPADFKKFRRKTDVSDCQWLQTLHTFGLLRGSFRPEEKIVALRSYLRHRDNLVKCASDEVRRMQKALEQMNVKLTHVISDITGMTGTAIIRAILGGERDPQRLAELRQAGCKNDARTIALALQGNWREEHLFALRQAW